MSPASKSPPPMIRFPSRSNSRALAESTSPISTPIVSKSAGVAPSTVSDRSNARIVPVVEVAPGRAYPLPVYSRPAASNAIPPEAPGMFSTIVRLIGAAGLLVTSSSVTRAGLP
jgi:hypothetical protein